MDLEPRDSIRGTLITLDESVQKTSLLNFRLDQFISFILIAEIFLLS